MDWLSLVPSALSAVSSLFGKKAPQYQAPQQPSLGDMSNQLNQAAPLYDLGKGQVYSNLMNEWNQGLPAEYRNQVLGNARAGAQENFRQISDSLNMEREKAQQSNAARMNKLGILSSGATGITSGMIDQSYGQQLGNLAGNLQTQLGGVNTDLMTQELQMRQRVQDLMAGLEQNRASNSLQARNGLAGYANNMGQLAQNNAVNQYNSNRANWNVGQANFNTGLGSLASAAGQYRLFNPYQPSGPTRYATAQDLIDSGEGASLHNAFYGKYK